MQVFHTICTEINSIGKMSVQFVRRYSFKLFFYTDSSHCGGKVGRPPKSWKEVLKNDFPE